MDRRQLVNEVMDLYDENQRLRWENQRLNERLCLSGTEVAPTFELGVIDKEVMRIGRKKVVDESLDYWKTVSTVTDDNDNARPQSFHEWLRVVVRRDKLPRWASYDDFVSYFEEDLRAVYEEKLGEWREGD